MDYKTYLATTEVPPEFWQVLSKIVCPINNNNSNMQQANTRLFEFHIVLGTKIDPIPENWKSNGNNNCPMQFSRF